MDDAARRTIALAQATASCAKDTPPEEVAARAEVYARFLARTTKPVDSEDREILAQLITDLCRFIDRRCAYKSISPSIKGERIWASDRNRLVGRCAEAIGNLRGEPVPKIIHAPLPEDTA